MDQFYLSNRPTLRQLEYAVAIADKLHFGRAAAACGVTQPGLSAQLFQLEELLGVDLFERSRRGVLVTAAGAALVERARVVLREVDELVAAAKESQGPLAGELRLGVIPTIAPYLLPRVLPAIRASHPALRLVLVEDQTERILRRLREGKLDLLLLALPVAGDDLAELKLYDEPFVLAVPAGHRLGAKKAPAQLRDLAAEPVLLLEDGHCMRQQALDVCALAGARETAGLRATSLTTLVQMVISGLGITLLPWLAAPATPDAEPSLAIRRFKPPAPSRTVGLVWRRSSARGASFRALGEKLAREARRLLPRSA